MQQTLISPAVERDKFDGCHRLIVSARLLKHTCEAFTDLMQVPLARIKHHSLSLRTQMSPSSKLSALGDIKDEATTQYIPVQVMLRSYKSGDAQLEG